MHPQTKVILRGRPAKNCRARYKNGVRLVPHLIFSIWASDWSIGEPLFVAESTDPVKWARTTRSQWKSRRIALWLRQRASEGTSPCLTILEEVWVPEGTRRSSRLAWWVRKLRPTLQGTLGRGDPDVHLHNTLKVSPGGGEGDSQQNLEWGGLCTSGVDFGGH